LLFYLLNIDEKLQKKNEESRGGVGTRRWNRKRGKRGTSTRDEHFAFFCHGSFGQSARASF
jgi:hypothetical protein